MFFHMYIASGSGRQDIGDKIFDDNRKAFSLCPYVASFKMILKSDFIHIFNDFIHVYSPGARAYNPLETNFWCQQNTLITLPIRCNFKKRKLILYTFSMILYMYIAPGQGQKLLKSTESLYRFDHLLQVSNKSLWILILYTFFNVFLHV